MRDAISRSPKLARVLCLAGALALAIGWASAPATSAASSAGFPTPQPGRHLYDMAGVIDTGMARHIEYDLASGSFLPVYVVVFRATANASPDDAEATLTDLESRWSQAPGMPPRANYWVLELDPAGLHGYASATNVEPRTREFDDPNRPLAIFTPQVEATPDTGTAAGHSPNSMPWLPVLLAMLAIGIPIIGIEILMLRRGWRARVDRAVLDGEHAVRLSSRLGPTVSLNLPRPPDDYGWVLGDDEPAGPNGPKGPTAGG